MLALLSTISGEAVAQQEVPTLGPGFAVVSGDSGQQGCLPRDLAKQVLSDRILDVNRQLEIDPRIAVVLSSDVPTCGDLFYAAVANDVRGIGYGHFYESEIFDESPDSALEGIAFLNDIPYWEVHPEELGRAFLHEVGHRYGARVRLASMNSMALLGRDGEHWSYFLDTESALGVSPLEGNSFQSPEADVIATTTDEAEPAFSNLDLYLMGVLPPGEVGPLRLLEVNDSEVVLDCEGHTLEPASPPQRCESVSLMGSFSEHAIDEVIAMEGERQPEARVPDTPLELTMGFYVLEPHSSMWTERRCEFLQAQIPQLAALFEEKTRGRFHLTVLTEGESDCGTFFAPVPLESNANPGSSNCSIAPGQQTRPDWFLLSFSLLIVVAVKRRSDHISESTSM